MDSSHRKDNKLVEQCATKEEFSQSPVQAGLLVFLGWFVDFFRLILANKK